MLQFFLWLGWLAWSRLFWVALGAVFLGRASAGDLFQSAGDFLSFLFSITAPLHPEVDGVYFQLYVNASGWGYDLITVDDNDTSYGLLWSIFDAAFSRLR